MRKSNDWIVTEYVKYIEAKKLKRRMKEDTIRTVIKQLESELATDYNTIMHILEDPAVVEQDKEKGVAYSIHERLHHIATHRVALDEAYRLIDLIKHDSDEQ